MDLRLFEIFCKVYELRSFSRAAEQLYLTQPTISEHIKSLEDYFRAPLFDRLGRTIVPTRAGDLLYRSGRQILQARKRTLEEMQNFLERYEGRLTLGGSTIPGEWILPRILRDFRQAYPDIHVTLRVSDTRGIVRSVRDGELDLGFVGARMGDSQLQFQVFAHDELVLVAPPGRGWPTGRTVPLREVLSHPFVLREPGSGTRMEFEAWLKRLGHTVQDLKVIAEIGSTNGIKEAVKAGVGVSILSRRAIRDEVRAGWVREFRVREAGRIRRDFYVVRQAHGEPFPLARVFLQFLSGQKLHRSPR